MDYKIPSTGWVWLPAEAGVNKEQPILVYFRKKIWVNGEKRICKIMVSADSRYKLYINGELVNAGPCKGDREVWYCDEIDITKWLRSGENLVTAEVLWYPLAVNQGSYSVFRTEYPGFYLKEISEEENKIGMDTDGSWKCEVEKSFSIVPEHPFFYSLMIFEDRIGNIDKIAWKTVEYDDSHWMRAREINILEMEKALPPGNHTARPIPLLMLKKTQI